MPAETIPPPAQHLISVKSQLRQMFSLPCGVGEGEHLAQLKLDANRVLRGVQSRSRRSFLTLQTVIYSIS
jgi:hypothetical protein